MRKPTKKGAKNKAWKIFSEWIRRTDSDGAGYVTCVTCGVKKNWKEIQSGHFIDGRGNSILFEETCVHPQCVQCNVFLHGNKVSYYQFMLKKYGQEEIERLQKLATEIKKMTIEDYIKISDRYREKIESLN